MSHHHAVCHLRFPYVIGVCFSLSLFVICTATPLLEAVALGAMKFEEPQLELPIIDPMTDNEWERFRWKVTKKHKEKIIEGFEEKFEGVMDAVSQYLKAPRTLYHQHHSNLYKIIAILCFS